jgi:hypothetical protein
MDTKIVNEYHTPDKYMPIHGNKVFSPVAGHLMWEMWCIKWAL